MGNFRGTSGLLLSSTVRELPGKSPKNFRGSSGNFRGSPGTSREARGSLTPSQRLAKFVSNLRTLLRSVRLHDPLGVRPTDESAHEGCFSLFSALHQENSRSLWRSRRRKSSSVPEGGADFPAAVFLAGKCPNLGRDSISSCRKIRE